MKTREIRVTVFKLRQERHLGVLQFHLGLPGVPRFDEAEKSATIRHSEQETPVKCLSGIQMLAAKRAADLPQDQADIAFLEEPQRLGKIS